MKTLLLLLAALPLTAMRLPANWITHPAVENDGQAVVLFRTDFELAEVPEAFTIGISADNHFRLYVNGEWVAFGPQLGDITHYRYDSLDLTPHLRSGANTLAVQVTNWGYHRMFGMQSVRTALLIQGYGAADLLTTTGYDDDPYRCMRNPGIADHEVRWRTGSNDIIGGLYANNPTDSLYADRYPWNWTQPDYDDRQWQDPIFVEKGTEVTDGTGFRWLLTPRRTPPQERQPDRFVATRLTEGTDVPQDWHLGREPLTLPAGGTYRFLLDRGEVTFGFPTLRWRRGTGAEIKYTWAENLFNADRSKAHRDSVAGKLVKGYFDVVVPDGSDETRSYVPTWYRAFRYLEIKVQTGEQAVELYAPTLERVTSSIPLVAEWESDDPTLDRVVDVGRRTVEICTQDYFLSDAYYETMQYVGDTKVHALAWQGLTGNMAHTRNALLDFHHSRNADGMLKSCYPLRHNFYHSSYSLIYIDMVWDYFVRTHDTAFVRPLIPGIRQTLDYFDLHYNPTSGFLEDVPYKPFVDWYIGGYRGLAEGADRDASVPHTLQYAHALRSAARLNAALGVAKDDWAAQLESVKSGIQRCCYVAERNLVAERPSRDYFDQHSTTLALLLDIVPPSDRTEALETVVRDTSLSPATYYWRYYLLELLRQEGRADLFREVVEPWYAMVGEGATTVVERFESPTKPTRSEAHPWGAAPTLFVHTLLAGIDAVDPAGPVRMEPRFGHLRRMSGYFPYMGGGGLRYDLRRATDGSVSGTVNTEGREVEVVVNGTVHRIFGGQAIEL